MSVLDVAKSLIGVSNPVIGIAISYWKPIICVLALVAAYGAGYHRESVNCAIRANALREKQEQAIIDQQVSVIAHERRATSITTGVSNDYENAISAIANRYRDLDGVRPTGANSARDNAGIPHAAAGHNDTAGHNGFAQSVRRHQVEQKLDEQTQRLVSCQSWIRQQQKAYSR